MNLYRICSSILTPVLVFSPTHQIVILCHSSVQSSLLPLLFVFFRMCFSFIVFLSFPISFLVQYIFFLLSLFSIPYFLFRRYFVAFSLLFDFLLVCLCFRWGASSSVFLYIQIRVPFLVFKLCFFFIDYLDHLCLIALQFSL